MKLENQSSEKVTLPRDYFDAIYSENPDPWHFETKPYEHEKYATTLQNLPRGHYGKVLELGCSIGVLTQKLAELCDQLLALDASEIPLKKARERCAGMGNVGFMRATLPDEFPAGRFDLILMSEVGYYFALPELRKLQEQILEALAPGGELVCVHYLPVVPDYPLTGDEVHESVLNLDGLEHLSGFRAERYRFDAFRVQGV
jgi:SAM-dependent methyltransferase